MGTRYCKGCGAVVTSAWWCAACKAARGKPTRSHERYGGAHQAKRAAEHDSAYGKPCARCGRQLAPGQTIHLDHAPDGRSYLGWSHARCNQSAGGRVGAAITNGQRPRADATAVREAPPEPPRTCQECGRPACRRPAGHVSRCW